MLRVSGLRKTFRRRRGIWRALRRPAGAETLVALDDVSFAVHAGEIFGLLGPNGAGKSTLFKILSTLLLPDAGSAQVGDADVRTDAARVREQLVAVLANERSLAWRLSVAENLRLYSALHGLHGRDARQAEARALEITDLRGVATEPVMTLSSGTRQRVLLARAILARPRVLLLDEPTRSLDPLAARDFRAFLRQRIVGEQGCTVVLATHDADDVWDLCDRVGVLHRGRLLRVAAAAELRDAFAVGDDEVSARQRAFEALRARPPLAELIERTVRAAAGNA